MKPLAGTTVWALGLSSLLTGFASSADHFSPWRAYRATDGLTESLTTAITVSPRGNVWVKHGEVDAVSLLDGYTVRHIPPPGDRGARIYESRAGKLWSVYSDGLLEFVDDQWVRHVIPGLTAEAGMAGLRSLRPASIMPAEQDRVLLLLADRLIEYRSLSRESRLLHWARDTGLERFTDLGSAPDGGLWVAGLLGLARVPGPLRSIGPTTEWHVPRVPEHLRLQNLQRPFGDDDGGVTGVADSLELGRRVLVHFDGTNWLTLALPREGLRYAWRGHEPGQFWGLTLTSLVRLYAGRTDVERVETGANQYFDVAVQPRGVFWLATLEGLLRYSPPAWRTPRAISQLDSVVYALCLDRNGRLWLGTGAGLVAGEGTDWQTYHWPELFEPIFRARDGLYPLPNGHIAISATEQLWTFDPGTNRFQAVVHPDGHVLRKVLLQLPDGQLVIQTAGVGAGAAAYGFELFDGVRFAPWPEAPPPLDLGNELFFLTRTATGEMWMGGSAGPALWREGRWQRFSSADGYADEGALNWVDLRDGRIWCAGLNRISEFDGKTWTTVISGLDRVSDMHQGADTSVWVATGSGLYRYYKDSWVWVDDNEGLRSSACYALGEDRMRRLWVGTSRGVSQYFPRADIDPPRTTVRVERLDEGGVEGAVEVRFQGRDKWQSTPDSRILYSYRLDGGSWTDASPVSVFRLRDLSAGRHRLEVRAVDRNWNFELRPAIADFHIALPWHRDQRVLAVGLVGMMLALFFAAVAVNRHRQLRRSYAEVERKIAQRTSELQQATQALVHSQKMTALGTLAAGIAHDFNNILSIIKGSAQIIETNPADREKVLARVARIKTVVDQATGIVRAMLGFGRIGDRELRPCQAAEVVDQTLRLLGDRFLREVTIRRQVEAELPPVLGVRDLIQQMILNLIFNAADAIGPEGEVRLAVERMTTLPPNPVLAPGRPGPYVSISVSDNGCGMSPELVARVFEPFFSTKAYSSRRGTGLGLYMVYEFAKEMGLGLLVDSRENQGSTFVIVLPVAPVEFKPIEERPPAA